MDEDGALEDALRAVLREHPVRLGLLFGSRATGEAGDHSDVDVAVEFEPSVEDRHRKQLALGVALTRRLGTDDVDIVDLDAVPPEVGYSALAHGRLLVGDPERASELAERFDSERDRPTAQERRERFDEALDRLEELV